MKIACRANKYKWIVLVFLVIGSLTSFVWNSSRSLATNSQSENYGYYIKDENINLNITYGYDGYGKYGRYLNVHSDIYNPTMDFEGYLEVVVPKKEKNASYQKAIRLDSDEIFEVDIAVPLSDDTGLLQVKLINEEGKTILNETYHIKIGNYNKETYIGVLSEEYEQLEYLEKPGTKVFHLDYKHMTEDYYGLDMLDVIVINQFNTSVLSDGQINAVKKWVMHGGTLVVGTGEEYKKVISGLDNLGIIVDSDTTQKVSMDFGLNKEVLEEYKSRIYSYFEERRSVQNDVKNRNEMLATKGVSPIIIEEINPDIIKNEIINFLSIDKVSKNIADVSISKGEKILINKENAYGERKQLGSGNILLFQYDLGLNKEQTSISLSILYSILENLSSTKKIQLANEYYGSNVNYGITSGLNYADTKNVPKVMEYAIILIVYILLIGPISYHLLKKFDKRSHTWLVIPCLAIVFTLIVFVVGGKTRISKPFAGYLELKTYQEDNTVLDEVYFAITTPHNQEYDVEIDSKYTVKDLTNSSLNYYMENLSPKKIRNTIKFVTLITYEEDMTKIKIKNNPAFSPVYYQYSDRYNEKSQLEYDIHYTGNDLNGTISNNFSEDISNAILVSDGLIVDLGVLESKETVNIEESEYIYLNVRDELYSTKLISKISGATEDEVYFTGEVRRKYNVINYLIDKNIYNNEGSYVIGFTGGGEEDNIGLVSDLSSQMDIYGTKAVVIPVKVDYTSKGFTFVPSIDKYKKDEYGVYDAYYRSRYINGEELNLTYIFPSEDEIIEFQYLNERNTPVTADYLRNFKGEIYFKNHSTNKYEQVFESGIGSKVTDVSNYLNDNNELDVLYKPDISLQGNQIIVPHLSYLAKENESVRN